MNNVQRVLSAIPEADLRAAVAEMNVFGATGVLENGVIRRVARELAQATGVNPANALPIVQTHVVRAAAFLWAGLPVFPEYSKDASASPASEEKAVAAGKVVSSHVLPGSLVGKASPKFPGALCWEHSCSKAGESVLLPFGMKCADCQAVDGAKPRQRTAALLLGYRRAVVEGDAAKERVAGEALVAMVEALAAGGGSDAVSDEAAEVQARRAATRAEVLSDVDPVVLECWKLQGRKVGAMLADAQEAVIELQEKLDEAREAALDAGEKEAEDVTAPVLEGANLSDEHVLEPAQVYLDAANKIRSRPDKGNALAAARLLEDVYLATKDGAPKPAPAPVAPAKEGGEHATRLTVAQCAAQFRMYAGAHENDKSAQHQLNFCANFLEEYCTAPQGTELSEDLRDALDTLMRVAHNARRDGKSRALTTPECAILTADERIRRHGWKWDPMACPTVWREAGAGRT